MDKKNCEECNALFGPKENMHHTVWAEIRFCSRSCGSTNAAKVKARRKAVRDRYMRICKRRFDAAVSQFCYAGGGVVHD